KPIFIDQTLCDRCYPDCEEYKKPCNNLCIEYYFRKPEPEFKIEPKDLVNIQYLTDGEILSVYKAIWLNRYPCRNNRIRLQRRSTIVVLKTLSSFNEATSIIDETNHVAAVIDFYKDENLRNLLQKQEFTYMDYTPKFLAEIIKRYWDNDSDKCLSINEILNYISDNLLNSEPKIIEYGEKYNNSNNRKKKQAQIKEYVSISLSRFIPHFIAFTQQEKYKSMHLANRGFLSVYTAKWLDSYPYGSSRLRLRKRLVTVVLKILMPGIHMENEILFMITLYEAQILSAMPLIFQNESFGFTIVLQIGFAIVMKFCEDRSLRNFLQNKRLKWDKRICKINAIILDDNPKKCPNTSEILDESGSWLKSDETRSEIT
ncbi:34980_t:CDS:2, partial [Racocetra persica]